MSPREADQKVLLSLHPRVRSAYFRDRAKEARDFSVNMIRDNKKHAEAFENLKKHRSSEMAKEAQIEHDKKMVYNNKVKESKHKIVGYKLSERLL